MLTSVDGVLNEAWATTNCGDRPSVKGIESGDIEVELLGLFARFRLLYVGVIAFPEAGMLNTLAKAAVIDVAVGNRAAGSLARQRKMTSERVGEMYGLIRLGGVGRLRMCCCMISVGSVPLNGSMPVHIS